MSTTSTVCQITPTTDETYPRLLTSHPRNRNIDWGTLWDSLKAGPIPNVDLFIKTDRQIDVAWFDSVTFAVTDRLRTVLEAAAGGPVDFAPMTVNSTPYWYPRVSHVIADALDEEHRTLRRSIDGGIRALEHPIWVGRNIPDPSLFQLPNYSGKLFVTDRVVAAYEAAGCNGFYFWAQGEVK